MKNLKTIKWTLFIAFSLIFVTGCPDKKVKTPQCKTDKDCKKGHCLNGQCTECALDEHCGENEVCKEGKCADKEAKSCQTQSDCGDGQACKDGKCIKAECKTDEDCEEPKECQAGICVGPEDLKAQVGSTCAEVCTIDGIPFGYDMHTLLEESQNYLRKTVLACLEKAPKQCLLRIVGRTDNRGTNEYNLALGDRRARQIRKYLVRLGGEKNRMVVMPIGELEASATSDPGFSEDRKARFEWFESAMPAQ